MPALIFLGLPFPQALATHKVASVALGIGASIHYLLKLKFNFIICIQILVLGVPGVILGAKTALLMPEKLGLTILGFLTLFVGFYSRNNKHLGLSNQSFVLNKFKLVVGSLVLFLIGFLNGSFSSGTGLLVTITLVLIYGLNYSQAIGYTLIFVGLFWNGVGALVLGLDGEIQWTWLTPLVIGALLGGYCGANISLIKGSKLVKVVFEYMSILIGISLVVKSIYL